MATVKKKTVKPNDNIKDIKIDIRKDRVIPFKKELALKGSGYSIQLHVTNLGNIDLEERCFKISFTTKQGKLNELVIPTLLVKKPLGTGDK